MIQLTDVFKIYGENGQYRALCGVNLTIDTGEYIALRGRSGAGKSTLLHILGGMERVTKGEYLFLGQRVDQFTEKELNCFRRENVSFVFQNFALMHQYSVEENVELPLLFKKMPKKMRQQIIEEKLEKVGLLEMKQKPVFTLSGGEQQRCSIARALAADTPLILADEPTGALDEQTGEQIMELLDGLNREGKTILLVTHDEKIAAHAKRELMLRDGKLV